MNFLTLNYAAAREDDAFKQEFPYPEEFFIALRQLQTLGAPRREGPNFSDTISALIGPAMITAYFSGFDLTQPGEREMARLAECNMNAPYFTALDNMDLKKKQCHRLNKIIEKSKVDIPESRRNFYVNGIFDGINRWVFRLFKELKRELVHDKDCIGGLTGRNIVELAQGGAGFKMLRKQAGSYRC